MLDVQSIDVSIHNHPILSQVSLQVAAGEVLAVVGPNGAGKSTLIRAISGILPLQSGCITVDGKKLRGLPPQQLARLLAVVPQARQLPGMYTVYETILLGRTPYLSFLGHPGNKDHAAVRQAMEQTQTTSLAQRLVGELSGGEQQRVMLARALAQSTPLLLLDVPTTHLDLQHQSALLNLVRALAVQNGLAVLMVMHELSQAGLYADQVVLLVSGSVMASGTPQEVLTAKNLSSVFHVPVKVIPHPDYGTPLVLPDGKVNLQGGKVNTRAGHIH